MEISINKQNVYKYAMALTARVGKGVEAYANVSITEDNYPLLDVYLTSAITDVENKMRRRLKDSNLMDVIIPEGSDDIIIRIKDELRMAASVVNLACSNIRLYMAYYVAACWLNTTPANAFYNVYIGIANDYLSQAFSAIAQRDPFTLQDEDYTMKNRDEHTGREDKGHAIFGNTDYGQRNKDNVKWQHGKRLTDREILTVVDENDPELKRYATDYENNLLTGE